MEEVRVITAKEANDETNKVLDECNTHELNEIFYKIRNEIDSGNFYICESGNLSNITKKKLKELGYKVETGSQYNEPYYTIRWD